MLKFEYVDNEFKLLNIVVDVLFKLLIWVVWPSILNVELVERLFKFAVVARSGLFIMLSYIKLVKPEPEPTTKPHIFSDNNTVALLDVKLYQLTSYIPEPFWVCWVRAITYTAHPAPQGTAMGPGIQRIGRNQKYWQ